MAFLIVGLVTERSEESKSSAFEEIEHAFDGALRADWLLHAGGLLELATRKACIGWSRLYGNRKCQRNKPPFRRVLGWLYHRKPKPFRDT